MSSPANCARIRCRAPLKLSSIVIDIGVVVLRAMTLTLSSSV